MRKQIYWRGIPVPYIALWSSEEYILARGRSIASSTKREREEVRYALYATVYLGGGQRGDADNFFKCVADSLQKAGVIHSDARVRRWHLDVGDCDRGNPRTEIRAERIERRTA